MFGQRAVSRSAVPGKGWVSLGSVAALAVVGMVAAAPASAAPATRVDCTADASALQPAIDAASPGATLAVTGTCVGLFTINKDLTLTRRGNTATLDAAGIVGTALSIHSGSSVTLNRLIITGGNSGVGNGGGIFNGGTVTLNGTTVTGNTAIGSAGGGIANGGGTVIMNSNSTVTGNRATDGGGIATFNGTVIMNGGSRVIDNTADNAGGGIANFSGTLVGAVAGRNVRDNTPDDIASL